MLRTLYTRILRSILKIQTNPMKSILQKYKEEKLFPDQLSICILVLEVYNCRVSEILSAKWSDFFPGQFLILMGKKKSSNVIIRDREILNAISQLPVLDKTKIFPSLNYYHVYRHVKKYYSHRFRKYKKKTNFKVTHGYRYENVSQFANDSIIRDILHHRSIKSGKYYKSKKKA